MLSCIEVTEANDEPNRRRVSAPRDGTRMFDIRVFLFSKFRALEFGILESNRRFDGQENDSFQSVKSIHVK